MPVEACDIKVLEFSSEDFVTGRTPWPEDNESFVKSKFDTCLCNAWEQVQKNGVFWYNLDAVRRKVLPGNYCIVAQLNVKRFAQRRKPEAATQVMMPFNADKFHFGKIKNSEVLFELKRKNEASTDRIIINVSPIEYGHVLIIPCYQDGLPQVLNAYSIQLAVEVCLQTSHCGFIVGFNSLCALASVNHLHLHAMYVDHRLPVITAKTTRVNRKFFILNNYMVNGFVLQLVDVPNIIQFSRDVSEITSYLCTNNIAHNVVLCRRGSLESSSDISGVTLVTVYIFPKKPSPENTDDPFNCAFLELGGFLPMRDPQEYEDMTESTALQILSKYTLSTEEFGRLKDDLITVFSST